MGDLSSFNPESSSSTTGEMNVQKGGEEEEGEGEEAA